MSHCWGVTWAFTLLASRSMHACNSSFFAVYLASPSGVWPAVCIDPASSLFKFSHVVVALLYDLTC